MRQHDQVSGSPLDGMTTVAVAHAHPDDETLATGALLSFLASNGISVHLLTATRGEQGEVVPGSSSATQGSAELEAVRDRELDGAATALGLASRTYLGTPPARTPGRPTTRYRDSGMQWIRPGLAGPSDTASADSFTARDIEEEVSDLAAWLTQLKPDLLISYEADGGYGHPDHVRMHEVSAAAAARCGTRFAEIVPERPGSGDPGAEKVAWFELADQLPVVTEALGCHATQLTVDGTDVVHVGGQREPILTSLGLRFGCHAGRVVKE